MESTASYNCTQEELISVAKKGWASCLNQQADFGNMKPKYTIVFINGKQKAVEMADNLPTEVQRNEGEETARVALQQANTAGCANWQLLKRYITEAFDVSVLQIKLNAAGMGSYEKAANENWESSSSLMKLGNQFITDNSGALLANDNMPAGFGPVFLSGKDTYDGALTDFQSAESVSLSGTQTKTDAMNAVFSDLMSMFLDGQEIYKTGDDAMRKQFVFEQVLKLVSGNAAQGFKGLVTSSVSGLAIDKVVVTVLMTKHSTIGDKTGAYGMRNVAQGVDYTVTFQCPGFSTGIFANEKVVLGTMTTINVQLVPV